MKFQKINLIIILFFFCINGAFLYGQTFKNSNYPIIIPDSSDYSNPLKFWATQYYVHQANYDSTGVALKGKDQKTIFTKVSLCDWCAAAIEGTVYTADSLGQALTLNFAGRGDQQEVDCSRCKKFEKYKNTGIRNTLWAKAKGPFGDGVNGYILVPYRTIAVDKALFPIGAVFFIPSAKGIEITLPDGQKIIHDGYFFSADIGGDIKGNHIDVFTGFSSSNPFPFITSKATGIFTAYRVNQKELVHRFQQMHRY
jgi:3D (Asp-Asp-Asp) domain-containing protein